jgi:hypothetical protein
MGKLRRRELIPEDTPITAILTDVKLVHGQFGRQVETKPLVTKGEYKGTQFRNWWSFAKDDSDGDEFIPYGGPLYQALAMAAPDIDEVLDDDNLTEKKYQQFVKRAVKGLEGFEITSRVGIKTSKKDENKKSNFLVPGTFGPVVDSEEDFEDITMDEEEKAPF